MKGVVGIALIAIALMGLCGTVMANPPIVPPVQYEQFCEVFKATCSMCHQTGAAGAPIVGNKRDWGPRIAQGSATLHDHAIKGYTGSKGMMPAKGGNASLSEADVKAAVDYMVSKSQ